MLAKIQKLKRLLDIGDDHIALSGIVTRDEFENVDDLDFTRNDDFEFVLRENKKGIKPVSNFQVITKRNNIQDDSIKAPNPFLFNIPFALAIIGVVKAGKSTLMRSILDIYIDAFDKVILISPTASLDPEAIDMLDEYPDIHVFPSLVALDSILKKLRKVNRGKNPKDKVKTLIIMDDVINEIIKFSRKDNNFLNNMMLNRRHIGVSLIMMSQYFKRFPPLFRTNFTGFALFRQENQAERKKITEELSGFLGNKEFERLFNIATKDPFSALTINFDCSEPRFCYTKDFNTIIHSGEADLTVNF